MSETGLNEELKLWMEQMEKAQEKRDKYAKLQCIFAGLAAAFTGGAFLLLILWQAVLIPPVITTIDEAQKAVVQAQTVMTDLDNSLANLDEVAVQLAKADFEQMFQDVTSLTENSEKGIAEAMEKIDRLDMDGLNQAIKDLGAIVAPLANLLSKF